jgi:hypothetical protein
MKEIAKRVGVNEILSLEVHGEKTEFPCMFFQLVKVFDTCLQGDGLNWFVALLIISFVYDTMRL